MDLATQAGSIFIESTQGTTMPQPLIAINFCQEHLDATDAVMTPAGIAARARAAADAQGHTEDPIGRIYLGSYYCEHLFLALSNARMNAFEAFCETQNVPASVVIPLTGENSVDRVLALALQFVERYRFIDEVVVNDLGMLAAFAAANLPVSIQLGRLWHKEIRDPRYETLMDKPRAIAAPDAGPYAQAIAGFEIDPVAYELDLAAVPAEATCALHLPYCHLSTGRICTAQARGRAPEHKFLPGEPCHFECLESFTWYTVDRFADPIDSPDESYEALGQTNILRKGRAVQFDNAACRTVNGAPTRVVIAPRYDLPESEAYYG